METGAATSGIDNFDIVDIIVIIEIIEATGIKNAAYFSYP